MFNEGKEKKREREKRQKEDEARIANA